MNQDSKTPPLHYSSSHSLSLYDAHNHLQDERFAGRQEQLVAEARAVGVVGMVVNGSCAEDWSMVAELARRFPSLVTPSFGLHPWYVPERPPDWAEQLEGWLDHTGGAVGEIGLDRWKPDLPWEGQEEVFLRQLEMAAARNVPASIHCLQAWGRLVELLEQHPRPACGFVLHSYGGSVELVDRLAGLGAYFSLPGAFAREQKTRQREAFRMVPPERLLIETDAPDQHLPARIQTYPLADPATGAPLNHPAHLAAIYGFAAELLGWPLDRLAEQVGENFRRLFGLRLG